MKKYYALIVVVFGLLGCTHRANEQEALVAVQIQDRNGITETVSIPERLQQYEEIDFFTSQPYKKVLRVYKKAGKNRSIITSYHPNGNIAQYLEAQDMRANGHFREWFSNGQVKIDAVVIGGTADITSSAKRDWLFDGICHVWDEQGNLLASIPYNKGALEGLSETYYPSGGIRKKTMYSGNLEEGESSEFYPSGNLRGVQNYTRGKKHGDSSVFFENGHAACTEIYREGFLLGGLYYNVQGEQIGAVHDGRGIQVLYEGSFPAFLVDIHQGVPEGMVKKFNEKGELSTAYFVKNGKKQGEEIDYYPLIETGGVLQQKLSVHWEQDLVHGIVKTWYPNGQLESQREYCRNERLGPSCAWYRSGDLMLVEEYEEGKLWKGAYYKKGKSEPVSTIVNGNGTATLYDEQGALLRKVLYVNGKPTLPED